MRRLVLLVLLTALAGCGGTASVREPDLEVQGSQVAERPTPAATPERGGGLRLASARIAVVSHGQASDPFWAIVKKGLDDAARQTGVAVSYRAPDSYDIARMRRLIDEAISARLDGLIVSLPDVQGLRAPIRRARRAGIPVVSINSGSDRFRDLGIPVHVGQPEFRAGFEAGRRMAAAGVRRGLCVNQEEGNDGLDQRCRGFGAALARSNGSSAVLGVDLQDPDQAQQRITQAVRDSEADGILTLGTAGALPALAALRTGFGRRVQLATFDLSPEVLQAVRMKRMLFAVDQQAVPAGLPAGRAAGRALAPHAVPAARRADPDRARLRDPGDRRRGARAQPARLPLRPARRRQLSQVPASAASTAGTSPAVARRSAPGPASGGLVLDAQQGDRARHAVAAGRGRRARRPPADPHARRAGAAGRRASRAARCRAGPAARRCARGRRCRGPRRRHPRRAASRVRRTTSRALGDDQRRLVEHDPPAGLDRDVELEPRRAGQRQRRGDRDR